MTEEGTLLLVPAPGEGSSSSNGDNAFPPDESLFLMEVPEGIDMTDARIVGEDGKTPAALVLKDRSYIMYSVESSNTYVVVPPDGEGGGPGTGEMVRKRVSVCPSAHYDLVPHYLDYSALCKLLSQSVYEGRGEETERKLQLRHTADQLCVTLQVSGQEMAAALKRVEAFKPDSESEKVTLLGEELMSEAFEEILACVSANDWDLNAVEVDKIIKAIGGELGTERAVLTHVLSINSENGVDDSNTCQLDVAKIAKFKARYVGFVSALGDRSVVTFFTFAFTVAAPPP